MVAYPVICRESTNPSYAKSTEPTSYKISSSADALKRIIHGFNKINIISIAKSDIFVNDLFLL